VVQWWAIHDPDAGNMSIGGLDASNTVRVVFNSSPTESILQDAHGTFEIDFDGTKVVSSTFNGNPVALRTLALIQLDLAPSDANAMPASTSAPADFGQLHLTDTAGSCPKGSLIADCPELFYGQCPKSTFNTCMHDSGSMAAAKADIDACTVDWSSGGKEYNQAMADGLACHNTTTMTGTCSSMWSPAEWIAYNLAQCTGDADNAPSLWWKRLKEHGCFECASQWLVTTMTSCQEWRDIDFFVGHTNTCLPTAQ
jgi:hypothetical protein